MTPLPWDLRAQRVLYTSSPDRGLDIILGLWPRVLEQAPEATFQHAYAAVYDRVADQDAQVGEHREKIRKLAAALPSVTSLGSLNQRDLAKLMCASRVWCHPSWASIHGAPFHETSCIGAMEAQAAGCLVVASDWGALSETVQWGRLVNSAGPGDPRWDDAFVAHIVEGLTDPEVGRKAVERGPHVARDLGWTGVAVQIGKLVAAGDRR
jgi:glycosyltransferase involved in cell wall biosynthesis